MSTVSNSSHLEIERDNQSATGTKMVIKKENCNNVFKFSDGYKVYHGLMQRLLNTSRFT
jgi:hypothetical protein